MNISYIFIGNGKFWGIWVFYLIDILISLFLFNLNRFITNKNVIKYNYTCDININFIKLKFTHSFFFKEYFSKIRTSKHHKNNFKMDIRKKNLCK